MLFFSLNKKEWIIINNIAEILKGTRENVGLTLDEVSSDINISSIILTQLEEGNIGAFKDLFELKKYLSDYSKYLGLNPTEVLDEFNEYMFEKTSKLPMEKIEKALKDDIKQEANSNRIASPYTKLAPLKSNKGFVLSIIFVFILVVLAVLWSIKQITLGNTTTNIINYFVK